MEYEELRRAGTQPAAAAESHAWAGFATARLASEFCQNWLALQCSLLAPTGGGVRAGLLLLEDEDGSFAPAATWTPENHATGEVTALVPAAERALRERRGVVLRVADQRAHVAYPVDVRGHLWGVVVVDAPALAEPALQAILRSLHWGAGWVETLFHRRQAEQDTRQLAAARLALDMVARAAGARGLAAAATVLANELAVRLECRRVAIGSVVNGRARLIALSHAASLSARLRLSDSLANAMEEAVDQGGTVAFPEPSADARSRRIAVAHRDHARHSRLDAIASVVMLHDNRAVGVITLERDSPVPFDAATLAMCEATAGLLAPVLALQRDFDRPLSGRAVRALGTAAQALLGPAHPTAKLAALAAAGLVLFLGFAQGEDRIAGKATLEGEVQRAAVAPFEGYVATAPHRAGDVVGAGELIASLDTTEIDLEALRYEGQADQARLKQQDAEGKHDRAQAAISAANATEAEAQAALAREKSARANIRAPYRGLIVSGDLSQQLGAPVERGKVLFEIAPLDRYRVSVQVDERDLARVHPGQRGRLLLNGISAQALDFTLTRIVPVAVPEDGRNSFRVEALLDPPLPDDAAARLRPGMEGVGKITAGQARLIWTWTHPLLDWLRLFAWKWLP